MVSEKNLENFRKKIDKIDNKIINLLYERIKVVHEVAEFKKQKEYKLFIHSAREADMIKNLLKKCNFAFPKSAIISIWRKIITSANNLEQKLKIGIYNPCNISNYFYQTSEYYGDFVKITLETKLKNIFIKLKKNQLQIAIFALPSHNSTKNQAKLDTPWWFWLANNEIGLSQKFNPRVFSLISLKKNKEDNLVAVGIKEAEKSSSDNSLIAMWLLQDLPQRKILSLLKKVNIKAKILDSFLKFNSHKNICYLLESSNFYSDSSLEIIKLAESIEILKIRVIGNYPTPFEV
jgi:chorismate mutase